jgi:hypothetical protein
MGRGLGLNGRAYGREQVRTVVRQQVDLIGRSIRRQQMRWFLGLLTLLVACSRAAPVEVCQYWLLPAVTVEVTDELTGNRLTSNVTGFVRDGVYNDSLRFWGCNATNPGTLCAALERPGAYDVEVTSVGYQTWSTRGVVVTKGSCHVNTVALKAKLVRAP